MPESDLPLLTRAAHEAGEVALRYWRNSPKSWEKEGNLGPVSEADLAVNDHLCQLLRAARPDYGWLSEETPDDPARLTCTRCFIVDPIDGTRAYLDGQTGFSIALAVTERGQTVAAAVHLPAQDVIYQATKDGPALRNGVPIHARQDAPQPPTALMSGAAMAPEHWRDGQPPALARAFRPSLAWRMCLVAEGRFDATLSLRDCWEWDIAAGALIASRAGCTVTDRRGAPLSFNQSRARSDGLVVAEPGLHSTLIARLVGPKT